MNFGRLAILILAALGCGVVAVAANPLVGALIATYGVFLGAIIARVAERP